MTIKQKLLESIQAGEEITPVSFDSILEGTGITPELQAQLAEAFESAVVARAKSEVEVISEIYESKFTKLDESFQEKFASLDQTFEEKYSALDEEYKTKFAYVEYCFEEKFTEHQTELNESVNSYLDYTASEYVKQNSLAIESGLKSEITEGFITGLKSLFESNFIDIPEEKADLVSAQDKTIEELKYKLKEAVDTSIQYKKQLNESQKRNIVDEFTASLTDTESERFHTLSEEISFSDADSFRTKLAVINENYFKPTSKQTTKVDSFVVSDTPVEQLSEAVIDPSIAQYVSSISQYFK
jgi:hypothetical protein